MDDDRELIARYRQTRDPDSFRSLVERHQDRVFRLIVSILGPAHAADAEELAQDVFLQVHRKFDSYREDAQFSSWLYRIAWNRATDHRRRVRYQRPALSEEAFTHVASDENPLADLESSLQRQELLDALETLPGLYRTLIHLYYWMGCSLTEIRELTDVPAGTAKSYLARARARLKVALSKEVFPDE
jgi:RNA polymerase sigma-70 factor (ECF subfamily)